MKIDKITLCNLTSIEGEQTIDFTEEPLRSAGLFAITGDVGSGKSTILDAICLALYNRAPRFDNVERIPADDLKLVTDKAQQVQATNTASILRRGQKQGWVSVTFTTTKGHTYEATWSVRVKRSGTIASPERQLTQLAPEHQVVDKAQLQACIDEVVGLTYEQFTRTVILAQNSFANFLRAKQADKAALLEKLTGTEVYSAVSERIFRLAQQAEANVAALQSEMQGLLHTRLDAHLLAEQQERARLLEAQHQNAADEAQRTERQLEWIARFDQASAHVAQCEEAYDTTTKACVKARADEMRLQRYDAVLDMQPLYQAIKMRRAAVEHIKADEAANAQALNEARQQLDKLSQQLDVACERTADAEKRLDERRPAINRGYALTGEIKVANEQLKRLDEQLVVATQTYAKRQATLQAKQEEQAKVADTIKRHQLHKQSLEAHRQMFDKFDLIMNKLPTLGDETRRNVESHNKQTELRKRQTELRAQGEKAEQEQHNKQARLNALKSELLIHRQTNQGHDSAKLQKTAADNRSRLTALERAAMLWQHISDGYARISEKTATQRREETELAQKQTTAARMEVEVKVAEEAFSRIATTYTLSQSQNIVQLRKQLKEGTACPVCGATHHPYHTETERELGELLSSMAKEYADLQQDLLLKRERLAAMREEIAADAARIGADGRALDDLKRRQQADVEEWQQCAYLDNSFADCSATVNRDARRMMIQLLIDNTTRAADEADKELEAYNFHQGHINRLNEEIDVLKTEMETNQTYLDNVRTAARIASASAEELQQVINESDRACSELYTDLDEMITLSGWFAEWKNNSDGLRLRLTNLHADWNNTCKMLDEAERQQTLLHEEIKNAEANVAEEQRHVAACRESRDATREALREKDEELRRLMPDTTPQKVAEALEAEIAATRAAEGRVRKACEEVKGTLRQLEGHRDNLLKTRLDSQAEQQKQQQELDLMILRFNGTHSPVQFAELDSIFTDATDWKALRQQLSTLSNARLVADNNLQQARKALQVLQGDAARPATVPLASAADEAEAEQPADGSRAYYAALQHTLEQTLDDARKRLADLAAQLSEVNARLLAHRDSSERAEAMQQRLDAAQTDAREWARLNAMFGSADGKKFRTMAQSYTFGYLVAHANRHLQQLSPRYELRNIPGTLTLEIIDHDMFDEHRYVTSLSGGETFVVSLALALGLASLSGSGLVIGSLFIDEGFGNLDRESLDLVMLALSNLENTQGRKVGVISHTEQIRSQIQPQVVLCRRPGGSSYMIDVR